MTISKRAGALALAVCTCVAAFADEEDPTIARVLVNGAKGTEGAPGAVVALEGRGFHRCPEVAPGQRQKCRHAEVKVAIGSKECQVVGAGPESVTFIVPHHGLSPGRTRIKVDVAGKRTEVPFTVISLAQQEATGPRIDDAGLRGDAGHEPEEEMIRHMGFAITRFERVHEPQGGVTFQIEGEAKTLPDGFEVEVALSLDRLGRSPLRIAAKRATVARKAFAASFGPYRGDVVLGSYEAAALFQLGEQAELRSRKFVSGLTDEQREAYAQLYRRTYLAVGAPEELAAQRAELHGHYDALGAACEQAREGVDLAAAHRSHAAFRERFVIGLDPEAERCCERMLALAFASLARPIALAARDAIAQQRRVLRRTLGTRD